MGETGARASRGFLERAGIEHPIVCAPMGGATTVELVAAVSNAGGLGSLPGAYLTPATLRSQIEAVRRLTDRPFAVNLFADPSVDRRGRDVDPAPMLELLARHHAALGLPRPEPPSGGMTPFEALLEPVVEARVPVFSFTFGIPPERALARLRKSGALLLGTATTVGEGLLLRDAGVDGVVAQGAEAGAHRGTFAAPFEAALVGTIALVPQLVDALGGLLVLASGGIMDGRGIVAAEVLGASAVQLGTAFLVTDEASIPEAYKQAILAASDDSTRVTRAFSGRPARGIVNAFMRDADAQADSILPYPLQNVLTRPMRNAASRADDAERLSLWAGQAARLARRMPAAELVRTLVRERDEAVAALAGQR